MKNKDDDLGALLFAEAREDKKSSSKDDDDESEDVSVFDDFWAAVKSDDKEAAKEAFDTLVQEAVDACMNEE